MKLNYLNKRIFNINFILNSFFFKKKFGLNFFFKNFLKLRLEIFLKKFYFNNIHKFIFFFNFNIFIFKSIKKKWLLNIFFLYFFNTYKGYRHLLGLPVNGQRTWTNAWTCYVSNLTLRNYKKFFYLKYNL